jgi:hypothetical protein
LNDFGDSKKRIMQEIGNFERDTDRDVRDIIISPDSEKTDLPASPMSSSENSGSKDELLPPLPPPPPFQVEIDPPPPFEEHESGENAAEENQEPLEETSEA